MEQPLDFSKATSASNFIKAPPASVTVKKQLQRMKLKNRKESSFHLNSENSDEGTSRSSASSPDSVNNDLEQLGNLQSLTGQSSLTDKNLMMLINQTFNSQIKAGVPNVFRNLGDPHTPFLPNLYAANMLSMAKQTATQQLNSQISNQINSQFTNQLNNQINSQLACQLNNQISNQYNHLNQIGQMSDQLSQTNLQKKSKSSKSKSNGSNLKPVSRKSMILAKQEQEQNKLPIVNANFGILSNSQNSNILQDIDKESNCSGSMILNTSQMSIHSNLSGEENNGLFDDVGSLDGESPNSARRRRGQPIPEAMKDDSYWMRRRKNNEAAKKSRDAKRAKDIFTAKRAALLEQENTNLKQEISQIRNENLILKSLLGDELFRDGEKRLIDEIISNGRKMDPEKVRRFADEFSKVHSVSGASVVERMES